MTAQFSERLHYSGEKLALCAESLGCCLKTVRKDFQWKPPPLPYGIKDNRSQWVNGYNVIRSGK